MASDWPIYKILISICARVKFYRYCSTYHRPLPFGHLSTRYDTKGYEIVHMYKSGSKEQMCRATNDDDQFTHDDIFVRALHCMLSIVFLGQCRRRLLSPLRSSNCPTTYSSAYPSSSLRWPFILAFSPPLSPFSLIPFGGRPLAFVVGNCVFLFLISLPRIRPHTLLSLG